ncbi:hypothetical protein KP509_18G059100 [Ceratopteris richardii]|uniref:Uncharacterized protein n=1 Tax=Ceratopteris richardii TaxID=49495 RepID=A0A8T2SQ12_CERRI|nr:hypothetical protein KP509_18G059100 [Ceratopteris richardii]
MRKAMAAKATTKSVPKTPKPSMGTPSMTLSFIVSISSLLLGASIVHNMFKPDLTIPELDPVEQASEKIESARS